MTKQSRYTVAEIVAESVKMKSDDPVEEIASFRSQRRSSLLWPIGEGIVIGFAATEGFIYAVYQIDEWVLFRLLNILVCLVLLSRLLWKSVRDSERRRTWVIEFLTVAVLFSAFTASWSTTFNWGRQIVFSNHESELSAFVEHLKSDNAELEANGEITRVTVPPELTGVVREAWVVKSPDGSIYVELITGREWPSRWVGFVYISGTQAGYGAGYKSQWDSRQVVGENWWAVFG